MKRTGTKKDDLTHAEYKKELRALQIELVKLQRHIIKHDHQILVIFEGRDASGKDGVIKRIVQHLSPRETRVVALGKPSELEQQSWYFQRYTRQLPTSKEMVLFNRSWYNRAGVEHVMGFCSAAEYEIFLDTVNDFEKIISRAGIHVIKYYLDISKREQRRRLADRRDNPLKQWKISPIDEQALNRWDDYSRARNAMLQATNTDVAPWTIVRTDNKRLARLSVIRDLLSRIDCPDRKEHLRRLDSDVIFPFNAKMLNAGKLAR
tara:strand:- start:2846 stop:3634 length:789 start_codon:yes stop_codon:yes gene_type:complete